MTEKHQYDKKKLIILRAALIAIGAAVGATAVWQYFVYFPDVVRTEFEPVIIAVSGAMLALILALSAKPFYRLGAGVAQSVAGVVARLGAQGVASVALGLVAAGIFVLIVDVIVGTYQNIWAVRLLADVLVYVVFAALCCYGFAKWLTVENDDEEDQASVKRGYLLAADCLADDRALSAAYALQDVKVCDGAYKALCLFGGDAAAVKRLDALVRNGVAELVRCKTAFGTHDEYVELERALADKKRLRHVAPSDDTVSPDGISLDFFAAPHAELLRSLETRSDPAPENTADAPDGDAVSGRIIIDK